jgi:hypothetical protein
MPIIGDPAQPIGHGDALDDGCLVLEDDLADRLDVEVISLDLDVTRFQRAGKGARQSPTRRRDHVVKRGGTRREVVGSDAVLLGHLGMDAEVRRTVTSRRRSSTPITRRLGASRSSSRAFAGNMEPTWSPRRAAGKDPIVPQ